tara:strand:- start:205 stop:984 length:780 start_codon:yes stop_codon:yes gene_type:complete
MINFYGCSFSDGGGLDRWDYFESVKDKKWVDKSWRNKIIKEGNINNGYNNVLYKWKDTIKFPTIVAKSLGKSLGDYAYVANNNQNIRDTLYDNIVNGHGKIHVVQWTIFQRRKVWFEDTQVFHRLQSYNNHFTFIEDTENIHESKKLAKLKNEWLTFHYNEDYEREKVFMYSKLLSSFAKEKNHLVYFMFYDSTYDSIPDDIPNVIRFGDEHTLNEFTNKNNLLITDETDGEVKDLHFSKKGNEIIADIILGELNGKIN